MSYDAKSNENGQHPPREDRPSEADLRTSTLEMADAVEGIQSALEVLRHRINGIATWAGEHPDVSGSTRDLGAILLGASQAALDQRAEIESERERILASARQMAHAIISEAEARARSIVSEARDAAPTDASQTRAAPRVDATLAVPKVDIASPEDSRRLSASSGAATNNGSDLAAEPERAPRPDPTLIMTTVAATQDPDEDAPPPSSRPARPSRAADLLATLDQITEANASLAGDIAAVAEH